eukprot:TRINITY_DN53315_c0_g3_i1.p1 TRINITY_DN53315_c0_g3~~TRINITY_DN53315_c0_g3_i1.p1  ORF type:complete len:574 (-),score=53.72 TRINITY_DN53315_c0_g3_i1:78-1799(-)
MDEGAVGRLASALPQTLLRGVSANRALQGYGMHWKNNVGGPENYYLSEETEYIDDFISHDWRTSRTLKYFALSYIYNSQAALIGSTAVALLAVVASEVLFRVELLPRNDLTDALTSVVVLGPAVYIILFFHWQRIRECLRRRTLVFVDKLCIAQHDEDKKREGIFGLASFLRQSNRIVVLWSPQYFSRLWCTYELATWFRYEKSISSVVFVPAGAPLVIVLAFSATAFACAAFQMQRFVDRSILVFFFALFLAWALVAYFLQGLVHHVADLSEQLKSFSIQASRCFCCTCNHVHPETGEVLHCDRELVYKTLLCWRSTMSQDKQPDSHLSAFNREVRGTLREYVTAQLPERLLFISYGDLVYISVPILWATMDNFIEHLLGDMSPLWIAFYVAEGLILSLLSTPLALAVLIRVMVHCPRCWIRHGRLARLFMSCFVWAPFGMVVYASMWYAVVLLHIPPWLWFITVCLQAVLAYCVLWRGVKHNTHGVSFSLGRRLSGRKSFRSGSMLSTTSGAEVLGQPATMAAACALGSDGARLSAQSVEESQQSTEWDGRDWEHVDSWPSKGDDASLCTI